MAFELLHFPRVFQIRQTFEVPPPVDPDDAVDEAFSSIGPELVSLKGMSVAVCVGSRGIDGIVPIVKRAVERIKAVGAEVFIMPAMGAPWELVRLFFASTYINCLTACCPEAARIPMTYDTDQQAIDAALATIRPYTKKDLGVVQIKNTMDLET